MLRNATRSLCPIRGFCSPCRLISRAVRSPSSWSLFFTAARGAAADARAHAVETAEEAVRGADVVCLCTSASEPVISSDWLAPGMHVTSVGYNPPGGELDRREIEQGRLFVETRLAFEPPPAGCGELAGFDRSGGTELGW